MAKKLRRVRFSSIAFFTRTSTANIDGRYQMTIINPLCIHVSKRQTLSMHETSGGLCMMDHLVLFVRILEMRLIENEFKQTKWIVIGVKRFLVEKINEVN